MNIYKPKALIDGYKLGGEFAGKKFVAIPQNKVERGYYIAFRNSIIATRGREPVARRKFQDKYGRGSYWLFYYEWKPEKLVIGGTIK